MGMARVALILAGFSACNGGVATTADGPITSSLLLSGTACGMPVSYTLGGDERIAVNFTPAGKLDLVAVLDGEFFSGDSELGWQTYAPEHDTYLLLAFDDPEPATPHEVTAIFDSLFGGRGAGVLGFVEHGMGESVVITGIDTAAKTIAVEFTLPIYGYAAGYPPNFSTFDECISGSVTGSFRGTYELASF
jgi:hypothetical protein